jgi:hypothetical protein
VRRDLPVDEEERDATEDDRRYHKQSELDFV